MALGANLGAVGVLAAVLLAGSGELNAVHRPWAWASLGLVALLLGFFVVRLPRSVGLPVLALGLAFGVWAWGDLKGLAPWNLPAVAEVRVVAQSSAARTVELRVLRGGGRVDESLVDLPSTGWPMPRLERLELPSWVPLAPLQWWRSSDAPASILWTLIPSTWRHEFSPVAPRDPQPWVVYHLVPGASEVLWEQTLPALLP